MEVNKMQDWFTIEQIDAATYIISEYRHWEETHCYLLEGTEHALLIDTGLGICDISEIVTQITRKPVTAIATHIHWDHIGGHKYYSDFYAHNAELKWLDGGFPQPLEVIKGYVVDRCELPKGFDINTYQFFQGYPTKILYGGEGIDLGGRTIEVIHTPGHSPGHMYFWNAETGYLFTGDLVYKGTLMAWFPSTDPKAYLNSLERVAELPVKRVFPAHHALDISPQILCQMRDAFRKLNEEGNLRHGCGTFDYGDWAVWL